MHVEKEYPGRQERQTLGRMSILYTERFDGSSANICPEKHFNQNAFIVYLWCCVLSGKLKKELTFERLPYMLEPIWFSIWQMGKSMENLSRYGRLLWIRKIRHHTNGVSDIKENIQKNLKKNIKSCSRRSIRIRSSTWFRREIHQRACIFPLWCRRFWTFCRSSRGRSDLMRR